MERVRQKQPDQEAVRILNSHLSLENKFVSPPNVALSLVSQSPELLDAYLDLARNIESPEQIRQELANNFSEDLIVDSRDVIVATAFQCYSAGETKMKHRDSSQANRVADSTGDAGHHTTRMHSHYTWHMIGLSRDVVERVFHAHPFYNSEQQSQRYTEAKQGNYVVPAGLNETQMKKYLEAADFANNAYSELMISLRPEVEQRVREMYPKGGWNVEKTKKRLETKIDKVCMEVSRYVLPISQKTTMYHTLNQLQLVRLFMSSQQEHFTDEARYVVAKMIDEVSKNDPSILLELKIPLPPESLVDSFLRKDITTYKRNFDYNLRGNNSRIKSTSSAPRQLLAESVRNIVGATKEELDDIAALELLMNPASNRYLADVYETGVHHPLTQCLRSVSITCATKLSHTAESQRQRQRRTPGATPPIENHYDGTPDYITPLVIRENPELSARYSEIMNQMYTNVAHLVDMGVAKEDALKLLPNAHAIRTIETGDLFDWLHRFKQRLCLLAQEEICFVSIDQVEQLRGIIPEIEYAFLAPCGVAHNAGTGKCPEGDRWCGQAVWNWKMRQYKQGRLI